MEPHYDKNRTNARMYDLSLYEQAGINPKNGEPTRASSCVGKSAIKRQLRIVDEQDAVNRFTWSNLPCNISGQELERLLYYRGQLCFFYDDTTQMFYFMPYALDGGLDFYGRYTHVRPIPICEPGESSTKEEKQAYAQMKAYLSTKHLKVLYDVPNEPIGDIESVCILIHDYTKQLSQIIIPRQQVNDGLLDIMADCIPFMRTNLLNSTGIQGVVVGSQDEGTQVELASQAINDAALNGRKYVPIMGSVTLRDLTGGEVAKSEEFMLAMQSLDNYRLSLYGLDNGGLFQKRSGVLEAEAEMNQGNVGLILQDSLKIRQDFCNIANIVFIMPYGGLPMWCEAGETAVGMDLNGDGLAGGSEERGGTEQDDTNEQ